MTSRSRKKRQTTPPSTNAATKTKLPGLRAAAWDTLVAGWRSGAGVTALCAALAGAGFVSPASAAERSVLVAPQNGASAMSTQRSSGETTVFKRADTGASASDKSDDDGKLKWRVRNAHEETTPTKVVRANAEARPGEPSRVTRASHLESDSPILRAANESVLVPSTGGSSSNASSGGGGAPMRPARKAPPRRLSPSDTRTARALQDSDSTGIFDQPKKGAGGKKSDDAPTPPNRRYGDDDIPDSKGAADKTTDDPAMTDDKSPAKGAEEAPMDKAAVDKPADDKRADDKPMDKSADEILGPRDDANPGAKTDQPAPATPMDEPARDPMRDPMREPTMPMPVPEELPKGNDTKLTPAEIEEYCQIEAKRREDILKGAPTEGGGRRIGEIEYCDSARDELRRRRVVDISVDISPDQPKGDDAPKCDRDWTDITGKKLFRGRPVNYNVATGDATFRTTDGKLRTLKLRSLSKIEQGHFLTLYKLPVECLLEADSFHGRSWCASTYTWKASGACHKPLYFEDVHLERYGHSWGPIAQPFVSAGKFFGTLPILPYEMGLQPPSECVYSLGYYRPGSCAPHMLDPLPISARAAAMEAGAWVGGVAIIP